MAYYLLDDAFASDPLWEVLAGGSTTMLDAIQAAYLRLCSASAHVLTDGYLTEGMARQYARPAVLDRLTRSVLGRAPRLHRPGDTCPCLADGWVDGYAYRIHRYLKRNPSRAEHHRNRQQKADLRDARLKHLVTRRDGGCCRYCGSGPLSAKAVRARDRRKILTFDHIDPDQPAGVDGANLVTCCARCNEHKGHRTPAEADLILLPAPSDAQRTAWANRAQPALYDPLPPPAVPVPETGSDHRPISDESPTDQRSTAEPVIEPDDEPEPGHEPDHPAESAGQPGLRVGDQPTDQDRWWFPQGDGAGRGGEPDPEPGGSWPMPVRDPDSPDVYTRRSRHQPTRAPAGLAPNLPGPPAPALPLDPDLTVETP